MHKPRTDKTLTILLTGAILLISLSIIWGGLLRADQSLSACPDWPTCFGVWTPPQQPDLWASYGHRLLAGLATLALTAAAFLSLKGGNKPAAKVIWAAWGLLMLENLWGGWSSQSLSGGLSSGAHYLLSLGVLTATLTGLYRLLRQTWKRLERRGGTAFRHLTLLTTISVGLMVTSGALSSAYPPTAACNSWPLCLNQLTAMTFANALHTLHRLSVLVASLTMGALTWQTWRKQKQNTRLMVFSTAMLTLFISQALLGAKLVSSSAPYLVALHQATATAVWACLALFTLEVYSSRENSQTSASFTSVQQPRSGKIWLDFLTLTKPIVVALLLVTTYAGMVIGAQRFPSLELTLWTLAGGFLAAGGSSAINQYIDRQDDRKMQRTQKRPLPSGRLTPGEGLAFGVGISILSFFVMVAFVNPLSALLTLAGILYYVVLYSLFLKKTTVQNIVIGGGAGAIPPLVGWAAATGGLNVPSLFLFAIVFMWTPPHFWALALVRQKDYARAGVPMLPVVRGEKHTRGQILIYTIELVILSLLLPVFGLGGAVYFIGAFALGGWLLSAAYRVWKVEGIKVAWKMYRYSSIYLAFLFLILMVDRVL